LPWRTALPSRCASADVRLRQREGGRERELCFCVYRSKQTNTPAAQRESTSSPAVSSDAPAISVTRRCISSSSARSRDRSVSPSAMRACAAANTCSAWLSCSRAYATSETETDREMKCVNENKTRTVLTKQTRSKYLLQCSFRLTRLRSFRRPFRALQIPP
jgi:hypothetical protein